MRRFAVFGLILLLPGCAYFGDFLGDTATLGTNPNRPVGQSETLRRVEGVDTDTRPLQPEAGNVWPTEIRALPTLQDLEKEGNAGGSPAAPPPDLGPYLPDHRQPRPVPGSSSAPPPPGPGLPSVQNAPVQPEPNTVAPLPPREAGKVYQTPSGPAIGTGGANGVQTLTSPRGNSIVVPNGNGTSTVIGPDGTIQTIQTPK